MNRLVVLIVTVILVIKILITEKTVIQLIFGVENKIELFLRLTDWLYFKVNPVSSEISFGTYL